MKCPKCSQSLWFSRTYCPFCKTAVPESPETALRPSPVLNWAVAGFWFAMVAQHLPTLASNQRWEGLPYRGFYGYAELAAVAGHTVVFLLGAWAVWRLYEKPTRGRMIQFFAITLILIWKSSPFPFMVTKLGGGHTFFDALRIWWFYGASSIVTVFTVLFAPFNLAASLVYWPYYCRWVLRPSPNTTASTTTTPTAVPVSLDKNPGP
jgi:hypothetical protein